MAPVVGRFLHPGMKRPFTLKVTLDGAVTTMVIVVAVRYEAALDSENVLKPVVSKTSVTVTVIVSYPIFAAPSTALKEMM